MSRYVALLRGVSPMNAQMPALKACFGQLGFTEVKTLLSCGNVVFSTASRKSPAALARIIEAGMAALPPRSFPVLLPTQDKLAARVQSNPFAHAQRVVTFLAQPPQAGAVLSGACPPASAKITP